MGCGQKRRQTFGILPGDFHYIIMSCVEAIFVHKITNILRTKVLLRSGADRLEF